MNVFQIFVFDMQTIVIIVLKKDNVNDCWCQRGRVTLYSLHPCQVFIFLVYTIFMIHYICVLGLPGCANCTPPQRTSFALHQVGSVPRR